LQDLLTQQSIWRPRWRHDRGMWIQLLCSRGVCHWNVTMIININISVFQLIRRKKIDWKRPQITPYL